MQGREIFFQALDELGWIYPEQRHRSDDAIAADKNSDKCFLTRLRDWNDRQNGRLTRAGQSAVSSLIQAGACLLNHWPAHRGAPVDRGIIDSSETEGSVVEKWVGQRFYLAHVSKFHSSMRYCSLACSRVGRGGSQLPNWPNLLDWALRMIRRDQLTLLAVPETTLYHPTLAFATVAQLPLTQLQLPAAKFERKQTEPVNSATVRWLVDRLGTLAAGAPTAQWHACLDVSPLCSPGILEADSNLYPLQDRFALALADRVYVLSVRPSGKLFGLIQRRLSEPLFPPGSLFVACHDTSADISSRHFSRADKQADKQADKRTIGHLSLLMAQGAVGWLVLPPPRSVDVPWYSTCTKNPGSLATHQICAPAALLLQGDEGSWDYLVHCTRGWRGALPQESEISYLRRLWHDGIVPDGHPLLTLIRILDDGYLRGTTWLTRGRDASVSLTAVPLRELLSRRSFRPHLGRWDWEPYGLLFRRQHLPLARPVIYAPASEYQQLNPSDRAYFQPADSKYDWSMEKEWRVVGDIHLPSLPPNAVTAFVRRRHEATQLARVSPFPVIWTEST